MKVLLAGPIETAALTSVVGDVAGLPPGTAPTPVNVLAVEYVRRGHQVTLITLDPTVPSISRFSRPGIDLIYVPRRKRARDLALNLFKQEIAALKAEILAAAPDIVHAHWTYEFAEAGIQSKLPLLVTAHDTAWDNVRIYADAYRFFRLLMALRTVPRIPNLTVVAPYLSRHMRLLGYFGEIAVVANGLDLAEWHVTPKALPATGPVIAAVGNGDPRKNIGAAVAAFAIVRRAIPDAELHLFGPGLDRYRDAGGVTVHDAVPNHVLRQFHQEKTTLLIHPSLQELCPVVIMEAEVLGIPVVAGMNSGGVPFVMGSDNGGLVDVTKPDRIAGATLRILRDAQTYQRHCEEGRDNAVRRFDIRNIADQYERIYTSVLSRRRPQALRGQAESEVET